uniref:Uncharacterized protein n=1 Tax=Pseudomonas fluorescens TaxID=294 RepID=A0A5E6PW61_PSEFL|nr:hypothetical protein PS652_00628 [Pseudomonas fluorescens]
MPLPVSGYIFPRVVIRDVKTLFPQRIIGLVQCFEKNCFSGLIHADQYSYFGINGHRLWFID